MSTEKVFQALIPQPRSVLRTGPDFPVSALSVRADQVFLRQADVFRSLVEESFGASVLAPGSGAEEIAWLAANPEGAELWGANFRRASCGIFAVGFHIQEGLAAGAYRIDCGAIEQRPTESTPEVAEAPSRAESRIARIAASDIEGAAAATATLFQLLAASWDGWRFVVPAFRIEDERAFSWRGLMLDSARHFIPVRDMERIVSLAALYKINRLHWHLTDDQGWRLELLNMPRVTAVGSRRSGDDPNKDGFYTREQIRSIVAFATDRGVTIVPEIDLPGHVQAVLAARPELACAPGPHAVRAKWGIADDVLCMGNPASLEFAKAAWDEVCDLFPGPFVHIGGDECPTIRWESCPRCAARKRELGLDSWLGLHGRFVRDIASYLATKGKTVFGWDEVLESALDDEIRGPGVFHWRAWLPELGGEALRQGRDLVRSPFSPYYFDFVQAEDRTAVPGLAYKTPRATDLRSVYEWDPFEGLSSDASEESPGRGRLLGIQANAWSEFIRDRRRLEYMLFPRVTAFAETAWSGVRRDAWNDYRSRLDRHRHIMDRLGINYCPIEFTQD